MSGERNYDRWVQKLEALPVPTQQAIATALLGRTVEIYINSTEQCNFRCRYCYEDFRSGRMSPSVIARVKRFFERRSTGPERMYLNWFGGEPLIASGVVLDISRYAMDLCAAKGIGFTGSVTTNAWNLTPALMQQLLSVGLAYYQVTLDGDQKDHDSMRVRADGSGTFSTVWRNLLDLRRSDLDFSVLLRVHLRPGNFESVRALLARATADLRQDPRFVIGLRPLENLGGPTGGTFDVLDPAVCDEQCRTLQREFGQQVVPFGTGTADESAAKIEGCGAAVCYACKSNAFLIRSDGRIGKCTVAMNQDYNTVGVLDDDGSLHVDSSRLRKWTDALYTLDPDVLACPAQRGEKYFRDGLVTITA